MERSSGAAPPRPSGAISQDGRRDGDPLRLEVDRPDDQITVVTLRGELDLSSVPRVEDRLLEQAGARRGLVVDLTDLSFIDSSGICLLIKAHRALEEDDSTLNLVVADGSQVDRVFDLVGIGTAIPLFAERDRAIAALSLTAEQGAA